jgi:hypothetical protein
MNSRIVGSSLAAPIPEEAGHRIKGTRQQFATENIAGVCIVSVGHGSAPAEPWNLTPALGLDVMRQANVNLALLV